VRRSSRPPRRASAIAARIIAPVTGGASHYQLTHHFVPVRRLVVVKLSTLLHTHPYKTVTPAELTISLADFEAEAFEGNFITRCTMW